MYSVFWHYWISHFLSCKPERSERLSDLIFLGSLSRRLFLLTAACDTNILTEKPESCFMARIFKKNYTINFTAACCPPHTHTYSIESLFIIDYLLEYWPWCGKRVAETSDVFNCCVLHFYTSTVEREKRRNVRLQSWTFYYGLISQFFVCL